MSDERRRYTNAEAQAMIDAAVERGDDHVILPPGVFICDGTGITIPHGFAVIGSDPPKVQNNL